MKEREDKTESSVLRHLPSQLQLYVKYPRRPLLVWILLCAALLVFLPNTRRFSPAASTHALYPATNTVSSAGEDYAEPFARAWGVEQWGLEKIAGNLRVSGGPIDGLKVIHGESEALQLVGPEGQAYGSISAPDDEGKMSLRNVAGTELYRYQPDDDGFKLKDPSGKVLYRVKIKEDKFNLYEGSEKRILRGKVKKGNILVRTEENATHLTVTFASVFDPENQYLYSSILSLPIPAEQRVLILAALLQ